jgi:hypothetical protein
MDDGTLGLIGFLHSTVSLFMFLAIVGALVAALYRFRSTPSGLLMAAAFGGFLLLRLVSSAMGPDGSETGWVMPAVVGVFDFLFTLVLAVGVGLIPHSLRKLPATGSASGGGGAPFAQGSAGIPATKTDDFARTLAAPDYTFQQIASNLRALGAEVQGNPSGEPRSASWSKGAIQVNYAYDPETGLRMLEFRGPQARFLFNDLINSIYMPTLEGYKVSTMLTSSDPREVLMGIRAAEFIGVCGSQSYYTGPVGALTSHPNGKVAKEARRVAGVLQSR